MTKRFSAILLATVLVGLIGMVALADPYIVASDIPWKPFEMITDDGEFFGFDLDLMRAIAVTAGFEIEIENVAFDAIIEKVVLQTGAIPSRHYEDGRPLKPQLVEALTLYMNAITDEEYMGLNRVMMSEYLRDRELALRVFERAEMHNNPIRTLIQEAVEAGALREVDADYATVQLTASMKAFFFWPKFIIGQEAPDNGETIIEDCVEMFLNYYQNPSNS